jgi:hypothetical protein
MHHWSDNLAPMGNDIVEKFFVRNAELIMPD